MTDIQEKLLELLTDLDDICKREGIKYYLCAETAHAAFMGGRFHPSCCQASVAMTPDQAKKFIAAVKKENRADRIADSMLSNKDYMDFTVRYGDPNTLMMQLPYEFSGPIPCIAVTIHMIRYKPKRSGKLYKYSKMFWEVCRRAPSSLGNPVLQAAGAVCHGIAAVFGRKNVSGWLFRRWCAIFSANKNAKKLSIGTEKYVYAADLLCDGDTLELEGKQFPAFAHVDAYLETAYGANFKERMPGYLTPSASLLISRHMSYQQYLERAREKNLDFDAISRTKKKYDKIKGKVSAYNRIINRYYAIVERTDKRFAMHEMYMPIKDQLLRLYDEKRHDELKELLDPYLEALETCYEKKLGLCFDKDIFELTMNILQMEGRNAYAKKLRELVPQQHWEPMVITDYKGVPVK